MLSWIVGFERSIALTLIAALVVGSFSRTNAQADIHKPLHNEARFLGETDLVKIFLRSVDSMASCYGSTAQVSLAFKVPPDYEIKGDDAYWRIVDTQVMPAVRTVCGRANDLRIDNYVDDFRIGIAYMGSTHGPVVVRTGTLLPLVNGREPIEQPISTASTGPLGRVFLYMGEADGMPVRYKTISALAAATYGNALKHSDPMPPSPRMTKDEQNTFVGALFLLLGAAYFYAAVVSAESATEADKESAKFYASQACTVQGKIFNPGSGRCF